MKCSVASTSCAKDWQRCEVIFDIDHRKRVLEELERKVASPDFWDSPTRAKATLDEASSHKGIVQPFCEMEKALGDAGLFVEMAEQEVDEGQRRHAVEDACGELAAAEANFNRLEFRALLGGKLDRNNAYLTLHAGAGGTESCDWADMLLRMYSRYCQSQGFSVEVLDVQPGDEAGIKGANLLVSGPYAYGYLKAERGVHRLVRISPFDANKRRHTSFASLDVVAEVDEDVEVEILDDDLRVDTYRSSGAGGQHVNKTDSAIRITHLPSGIVVSCQAERSQHKNRSKAMSMLRARLYEMKMDEQRRDREKFYGAKGEIAWGNQIRSYVLQPYTMAKDHRTGVETGNVAAVLDGDLDRFIQAYLKESAKGQGLATTAARSADA